MAVASVQTHVLRALRIDRRGNRLDRLPHAPQAAQGELLVRPLRALVSRLDVEVWRGLMNFEGIAGRSCVGVVESADGRSEHATGARVVVSPLVICGRCDMCRTGASRHCRKRAIMGMAGRDGCLADLIHVPCANAIAVPSHLDDDACAFALSVGSAIHVARLVETGTRAMGTVLGDGQLGLLIAQLLARSAPRVRVVGHYSEKLALCEKWGIKHRHADDVGRRGDQDVVIDCTGSPGGLMLAAELVRPRGRIVQTSIHGPEALVALGDQFSLNALVVKEVDLIGGGGFGSVQEGLAVLARSEIDVVSLISRRARLDDGVAIMEAAGQPGHIATLVSL